MHPLSELTTERPSVLLLDTNLLLLYLVGLVGPDEIARFNRTQQYSESDFHVLVGILEAYPSVGVTPPVFTETSNLTKRAETHLRDKLRERLRAVIQETDEIHTQSAKVASHPNFVSLGLADVGLIESAKRQDATTAILTDDAILYSSAWGDDVQAVNFTHIWQKRHLVDTSD